MVELEETLINTPITRTALHSCKRYLIHAAAFSAIVNFLYLAPSIYMLQVYDRVVPTRGALTLLFLTVLLIATIGMLGTLDYVRARLLIRAGTKLDKVLAEPILAALMKRPASSAGGNLTLREFDNFRSTIGGSGIIALFDIPWTPIYIFVAFLLHPLLGLLSLTPSGAPRPEAP